jgi:hypothetical protein
MSGFNSSPPVAPSPVLDEPLGLTVHSLPSGEGTPLATRTRSGRWTMIAVLLACAAPVIASYFTYYVIRPEGRRNYGELIDPQRPMPALAAVTPDGRPSDLAQLKGNWLLVSVADGACDGGCEKHLYLQRQLREALGKEKDRLDWVWLVSDEAALRPELLPALQTAKVLRLPQPQLATWLQPANGQALQNHLYLVDPLGNWMMRFPTDVDPAKAKRDIDRVLRGSAFWHKPLR